MSAICVEFIYYLQLGLIRPNTLARNRGATWWLRNLGFSIATSTIGPRTNSPRFFLRGMMILLSYCKRWYIPKDRELAECQQIIHWTSSNRKSPSIDANVDCEVVTWSPTPKENLDTSHTTVVAVGSMLRLKMHIFLEMANFHLRKWKRPLLVIWI